MVVKYLLLLKNKHGLADAYYLGTDSRTWKNCSSKSRL